LFALTTGTTGRVHFIFVVSRSGHVGRGWFMMIGYITTPSRIVESFMSRFASSLCLLLLVLPTRAADLPKDSPFGEIKYRSLGPSTGGRVSRAVGVPGDPLTYYLGSASGGVWKSADGGHSFKSIFDDQPIASIGSIAVAPSDANVIYVGSGEANIRGNVAPGNGIYKSTDAGKTWQHVWKQVGQIGTMIVHPANPDIAYAAVLGHAFGPNPERGIYRTRDGGTSWQRVLFKDVDTGASDVCFDPANPRTLFAGMWQARRRPWEMTSGGPGSGLHVSHDAGDTWEKLGPDPATKDDTGLPAGPYGRIGVAVAPSDPQRIYAMIEAARGGLYRSDDGGSTWKLASNDAFIRRRPWYFSTITIDPTNADVVWLPQVSLMRSIDGGKTFAAVKGPHHADGHDCWIDPKNPKRMIVANDGGVDLSSDGGKSWFAPPLPLAQFYHVACDSSVPYRVLGCMQDQGTASGPSNSLAEKGIVLGDWHGVGGGEAGYAVPDPTNPNIVYAGEYSGIITRYDHRTRQARHIGIYPMTASGKAPAELKYRFQWTSPIMISRHDPRVIYHAGNVLFRSKDGGQSWQPVGGDLTRDDKNKQRFSGGPITGDNTGVEVYGTIFALADSLPEPGTLWAGSDDGLVHISRNNGIRWQNVIAQIPDLPDWATIRCIETSPTVAGTAYLVADAHRLDDYRPYVWKTTDHGQTWEKIIEGLDPDVYAHVIREDPKKPGTLYLGTERGVMISRDAGSTWKPLQLNLPTVAVHGIVVKDNDLVLGTMGRGIWILDDLTAIRDWKDNLKSPTLFPMQPATRWRYNGHVSAHHEKGAGDNPPKGAVIDYYLKDDAKKPITIEILDAAGKRVIKFDGKDFTKKDDEEHEDPLLEPRRPEVPAKAGVNRFVWDLAHAGAAVIPGARVDAGDPTAGPLVSPGDYTVKIAIDGKVLTGKLTVLMDPRITEPRGSARADRGMEIIETLPRVVSPKLKFDDPEWVTRAPGIAAIVEEARQQEKFALRLRDDISRLTRTVGTIKSLRKQLDLHAELLAGEPRAKLLLKEGKELNAKLEALEERLYNPKAAATYDILAQKGGARLYSQLAFLYESASSSDGPPTQGMDERAVELQREREALEAQFDLIRQEDLPRLNDLARKSQLPLLWVPKK